MSGKGAGWVRLRRGDVLLKHEQLWPTFHRGDTHNNLGIVNTCFCADEISSLLIRLRFSAQTNRQTSTSVFVTTQQNYNYISLIVHSRPQFHPQGSDQVSAFSRCRHTLNTVQIYVEKQHNLWHNRTARCNCPEVWTLVTQGSGSSRKAHIDTF